MLVWIPVTPTWFRMQSENKQHQVQKRKDKSGIYLGSYRGENWSLCWKQRQLWGQNWAGHHQLAAQVGCSRDSYHCCTSHSGWPAWRSQYGVCNRNCRCSGHPVPRRRKMTSVLKNWKGCYTICIIDGSSTTPLRWVWHIDHLTISHISHILWLT